MLAHFACHVDFLAERIGSTNGFIGSQLAAYNPGWRSPYIWSEKAAWFGQQNRANDGIDHLPCRHLRGRFEVLGTVRLDNRARLERRLKPAQECDDLSLCHLLVNAQGISAVADVIRGEYALLIWDSVLERLYAFADICGLRTLYYSHSDGRLLVSWSATRLACYLNASFDKQYLARYLASGPPATSFDRSPFAGVKRLPAGYSVVFCRSGLVQQRAATLRARTTSVPSGTSTISYTAILRDSITKAVCNRLPRNDDETFWCDLSGGMDSTTIVALAQGGPHPQRLRCRSLVHDKHPQYSELEYIDAAARFLSVDVAYENFYALPAFSGLLSFAFFELPEPSMILLSMPAFQQTCRRILSSGAQIYMTGEGADHLLVAPDSLYLWDLLIGGSFKRFANDLIAWADIGGLPIVHLLISRMIRPSHSLVHKRKTIPHWLTEDAKGFLDRTGLSFGRITADVSQIAHVIAGARFCSDSFYASQAFGVERVFPYLDQELIAQWLSIPSWERTKPPLPKNLLREAMRGRLPTCILEKWNQPTGDVPLLWKLTTCTSLIEDTLLSSPLTESKLVDGEALLDAWRSVRQGDVAELISVVDAIVLSLWTQLYIDNRRKVPGAQGGDAGALYPQSSIAKPRSVDKGITGQA